MNRLHQIEALGQSVWLDYIRRGLIVSGELDRMVAVDGLTGVTANPTIFEKAIAGSHDYDESLQRMFDTAPGLGAQEVYEALAIEDIRRTADVLRPVFDRTGGTDGYASLEVSPFLAHDSSGTVAEARRLWAAVDRPNLLVKVPATAEGIPAIESLVAEGINVNATLMFSPRQYEDVAHAYLRGAARARDPQRVFSVASFFVSRVDTLVDHRLGELEAADAAGLRSQAGIANCRVVYARFREIFRGAEFQPLREREARVQKVLWASTSTKDPSLPDTRYVEELVGSDTINTLPPATFNAFRDHGAVRGRTIEQGLDQARTTLRQLSRLGIDLEEVGRQLQAEGVDAFAESFKKLFAAIEGKRGALGSAGASAQRWFLGAASERVARRLKTWDDEDASGRVWRKDPTFWPAATPEDVATRLDWLHLPENMHDQAGDLRRFADGVRREGYARILLLGMGGSSLAPEVLARTFGPQEGFPRLEVLDSTHPAAVRAALEGGDLDRTLFIVSSKSGTTLEPNAFFRFFWDAVARRDPAPGRHFIAITDAGTPLERLAHERGFRACFLAPSRVGGRYSALSVFGLVPAALAGIDVQQIVDRAWRMAEASAFVVPAAENPGLELGAALGELTLSGRDKVVFVPSPKLASFPAWAEQLIAESTGKEGKGIVPVAGEVRPSDPMSAEDVVLVALRLRSEAEPDSGAGTGLAEAAARGTPVLRFELEDLSDLGQEFYRWELAIAAAGSVIGIDPFDQPDVELAKDLARRAMDSSRTGSASSSDGSVAIDRPEALRDALDAWVRSARPGDYVAIQAYLSRTEASERALQELRAAVRDRLRVSTTLGFGPRFLHSTGQLHKGGPGSGLFLQIVDRPAEDVPVPDMGSSFGRIVRAQAEGDAAALRQKQRRLLSVDVGADPLHGLSQLTGAIRAAS
jgi:transaldolase/glucose-6-phosphate isomerase